MQTTNKSKKFIIHINLYIKEPAEFKKKKKLLWLADMSDEPSLIHLGLLVVESVYPM